MPNPELKTNMTSVRIHSAMDADDRANPEIGPKGKNDPFQDLRDLVAKQCVVTLLVTGVVALCLSLWLFHHQDATDAGSVSFLVSTGFFLGLPLIVLAVALAVWFSLWAAYRSQERQLVDQANDILETLEGVEPRGSASGLDVGGWATRPQTHSADARLTDLEPDSEPGIDDQESWSGRVSALAGQNW